MYTSRTRFWIRVCVRNWTCLWSWVVSAHHILTFGPSVCPGNQRATSQMKIPVRTVSRTLVLPLSWDTEQRVSKNHSLLFCCKHCEPFLNVLSLWLFIGLFIRFYLSLRKYWSFFQCHIKAHKLHSRIKWGHTAGHVVTLLLHWIFFRMGLFLKISFCLDTNTKNVHRCCPGHKIQVINTHWPSQWGMLSHYY